MTNRTDKSGKHQRNTVDRSRRIALEILAEVESQGAYANLALDQALRKSRLDDRSRGFVTELVYGTIKMKGQLDYILGQVVTRPLGQLTVWIHNILRLGLYQALYLRVPDAAAVNESVELAKRYGHKGTVRFVNGVLRNALRRREQIQWPNPGANPIQHIVARFSHPEWLADLWLQQLGWDETVALCEANNAVPPTTVRVNTLKTTRDELVKEFTYAGITADSAVLAPEGVHISHYGSIGGLTAFQAGLFQVQDESSMLVSHLLNPKAGEKIVDMCSAPGGKSTHIAELMENQGEVMAVDIHRHKLDMLERSAERLGITCIKTWESDARILPQEHDNTYDGVLLDAPCSGLGVLRRKPDLRWQKEIAAVSALSQIQRELLDRAALLVRPGGRVVYSTCTLTNQENEDNVRWFLEEHSNFSIKQPPPRLQPLASPEGWIRLYPHRHNTDGFFMVCLARDS